LDESKIRKLRALAHDKGAFANEAAVALTKAQALETSTPKENRQRYCAAT
jgi:hypothetical protein